MLFIVFHVLLNNTFEITAKFLLKPESQRYKYKSHRTLDTVQQSCGYYVVE